MSFDKVIEGSLAYNFYHHFKVVNAGDDDDRYPWVVQGNLFENLCPAGWRHRQVE